MAYIALFISYDGQNWYYPSPNDYKWNEEFPSTVQTWLQKMCSMAVLESLSLEGERKFWALSPCHQPGDNEDVLGYLRNVENHLEQQINQALETHQNALDRDPYTPKETVLIELEEIEPFIGKTERKRKTVMNAALERMGMNTILPSPPVAGRRKSTFSWFCGLYAQGRTVKRPTS